MKINEVEQLVGITKKNIRFYEEQGLLEPERNKQNGYREYSESDVELLSKIKLLRRLSVPIEEIRRLIEGKLSLAGCLERHEIVLNHESHRLELIKELSRELAQEQQSFSELQAGAYLEKIDRLENGGNCFMNVEKTDVSKKKKRGALISAAVIAVIVIAWVIFITYLVKTDPGLPFAAMLWFIIPPLVILAGVLIAVRERIKEINKGEEDEALKY